MGRPRSSWDAAGYFSRYTFSFVRSLLDRGTQEPLTAPVLEHLSEHDGAGLVVSELERQWHSQRWQRGSRASLSRALVNTFWTEFVWSGWYCFLESLFRILQPVLLRAFMLWLADTDAAASDGWWLASGLGLCGFGQTIAHHRLYFYTMRGGFNVRTAVIGAVFNKVLRVSAATMGDETVGRVVTLASADAPKFDYYLPGMHFIWTAPLDIAVVFILMSLQLDVLSATACLLTIFSLQPMQARFASLFSSIRMVTAKLTDERVSLVGELLAGIATVKAAVWEKPFARLVDEARVAERASIARSQRLKAFNASLYFVAPGLCALATFGVRWAQDHELTTVDVFSTMALIGVLRMSFARHWTRVLESGAEAKIAIDRIQRFLELPELGDAAPEETTIATCLEGIALTKLLREDGAVTAEAAEEAKGEDDGAVVATDACFLWPNGSVALQNVSLRVDPGQLLMVSGPVGSGKTALLLALLGELRQTSGQCRVHSKRIAYCGQQPWIRSGTLRDNVTFGLPFSQARFDFAINCCAMEQDLRELPHGDETIIGDRGVNLSGGQKARVALARAVYIDADVYLLDDPLSAVDPSVSRHLFEQCLRGALREKTVLLVTHQVQYILQADSVVLLDTEGRVAAAGRPADLPEAAELAQQAPTSAAAPSASASASASAEEDLSDHVERKEEEEEEWEEGGEKKGVLVSAEERKTGNVGWGSYRRYTAAGGNGVFAFAILLFVFSQLSVMASDLWLKRWAEQDAHEQREAGYFVWFCVVVAAVVLLCAARSEVYFHFSLKAATTLHSRMFAAVLGSPFSFFTANPLGRVLNKFSGDQSVIDEVLPVAALDGIVSFVQCLASAAIICVALPWALVTLLPIGYGCLKVTQRYLLSARELKRLEAMSRSPIFADLGETIHGLCTVRACGGTQRATEAFRETQDANGRAWFSFLLVSRWLGFRLDVLCALLLTAASLLGAAVKSSGTDVGLIGMAITYGIALSGVFQWAIRRMAECESLMTAVERQLHYISLPSEATPADVVREPAAADWPQHGGVEFDHTSVRYRDDLPLVLKDVCISIPGGSKVGIVGRTGSGKSSTIQAIFRLNSISGGRILIDGEDISSLPLPRLRRSLAMVGQDPFMFTGSLRFNLDPFGEYSDAQVIEVLQAVQLGHLAADLHQSVNSGSDLLSVGQRQLMSLARAALRAARVLVLDEATASVDYDTDRVVQQALREHPAFVGKTKLIIAHRVKTVQDADLVMVLDDGALVEHGSPQELMQLPRGVFAGMVASSST